MKIVKYKDAIEDALQEIDDFQTGVKKIIKTGRAYLDDIFPIVNGTVATISAPSSVGKTYELLKIANNVLDKQLNPSSDNYVLLMITLEMKIFNIVLRSLNKRLSKRKIDIISEKFTDEERALVEEWKKYNSDDRQFLSQERVTPESFRRECTKFIESHSDKETVFICYDHLALTSSDNGNSNKNNTIEAIMEVVNDLKMKYPNVVFFLVSQTNSDIQKRAEERSHRSQPIQSDLYYSGFTFQISDYVVVLVNPLKLGIQSYSRVVMDRYPNLINYFIDEDDKGKASLETFGVVYYHLLKCRESEDGMFLDIYAEDLRIEGLEEERKRKREDKVSNLVAPPVFNSPPTFDSTKSNAMHKASWGKDNNGTPF